MNVPTPIRRIPEPARTGIGILAVAGVYFGVAELGLRLALVGSQVTPLWPPTGIALACLLLFGPRFWPGIALGAFAVNAVVGPSVLVAAGISVGNTLAPICAYLLLRRASFRVELDRLRDALALVFLGAFAGMLVSATIGSAVLIGSGEVPLGQVWSLWSVWWTGDAMGVLTVAPLLLVLWTARRSPRAPASRWAEISALLLGSAGVTVLATSGPVDLLFLAFPLIIWAGLRFQQAGALPCALIVSTLTILAAAKGTGPFEHIGLATKMIALQAFNGSIALTALLLSAIMAERNNARIEVERACDELSGLVAQLAPGWPLNGMVLPAVRRAESRATAPDA